MINDRNEFSRSLQNVEVSTYQSNEYLRHTCWEATLKLDIVGKCCDVRAKMPAFIIRQNLHTHGFEAGEVHSQCKCKCQ